jgi:NADH:ubiquinone oxidoreductase subunit F (NADH-binding)
VWRSLAVARATHEIWVATYIFNNDAAALQIAQAMRDASICGLGQTASSAIESAVRRPELVAL